jgi:hypothetical protein
MIPILVRSGAAMEIVTMVRPQKFIHHDSPHSGCALIAIWGKQNAPLLLLRFGLATRRIAHRGLVTPPFISAQSAKMSPSPLLSPSGRGAEQVRTGHQHGHCSLGTALNGDPIFIVRVAFRSQRGWPVQSTIRTGRFSIRYLQRDDA